MHSLGAAELLQLWERGQDCAPAQRALLLLAWALPQHSAAELADLDLGLRDWHLLRLRRNWFGRQLEAEADCPGCGATLELQLDALQLQRDEAPLPPAPLHSDADGRRYRLPNGGDLLALAPVADEERAVALLLQRCRCDEDATDAPLPDSALEAALAALAAERGVRLELECAECRRQWLLDFDAAAFLWQEVRSQAQRLLGEVHCLAAAYGWHESDILHMSAVRRSAYLSRVAP